MASMTNPTFADYLTDMLLAGGRGRPGPAKIRKAMGPDGRFPDERTTRQMMQGKRKSADKTPVEYAGPHDLNYEETLLLRALRPSDDVPEGAEFDPEDFAAGMTGLQARNAIRTGDKTRGGTGKMPKDKMTKRAVGFVGKNAGDMDIYHVLQMIGIPPKNIKELALLKPADLQVAIRKMLDPFYAPNDAAEIVGGIANVNKPPKRVKTKKQPVDESVDLEDE